MSYVVLVHLFILLPEIRFKTTILSQTLRTTRDDNDEEHDRIVSLGVRFDRRHTSRLWTPWRSVVHLRREDVYAQHGHGRDLGRSYDSILRSAEERVHTVQRYVLRALRWNGNQSIGLGLRADEEMVDRSSRVVDETDTRTTTAPLSGRRRDERRLAQKNVRCRRSFSRRRR